MFEDYPGNRKYIIEKIFPQKRVEEKFYKTKKEILREAGMILSCGDSDENGSMSTQIIHTMEANKPITLISWNVNGIRAVHRKGLLVPFVEKYQPDILCLQETKAQQEQSEVDLPEYTEYWHSAQRKGYSGTALFTKSKPLSVTNGFPEHIIEAFHLESDGYGDPQHEGRVITAEFADFFVVTVYTPNAKQDLSRIPLRQEKWDPAFLAHCQELEKKKPVIFCGDLNVAHTPDDLAHPKQNEGKHGFTVEEREGFQRFIDAGFVDTFRMFHQGNGQYSWWSHFGNARANNSGWRIDYVLVSGVLKDQVTDAFILPDIMGSDHCPVGITFSPGLLINTVPICIL